MWDQLEAETKSRGLPERAIPVPMDAAFGYTVRNSIYRAHTEISELSASRDLKQLVNGGLLIPEGDRRGRIYKAAPILRAMRDRARESKRLEDPFAEETLPLPWQ